MNDLDKNLKKRILITGGCGFIGTHLSQQIIKNKDFSIRVLDLVQPKDPVEGVEYIEGDVRNESDLEGALKDVHVVYHFAAIVSVPLCQNQPLESYRTNFFGTLLLLELLRKKAETTGQWTRVIFSSTAAIYGNNGKKNNAIEECSVATEPLSFYAAQKLASENAIRLYHKNYALPAVIFRFFNVYGPGQDPTSPYSGVISIFLNNLKREDSLKLYGEGMQTRDFVSVYDVVNACQKALNLPDDKCDGQAINLGSGRAITILELAEKMIESKKIYESIEKPEEKSKEGFTVPIQKLSPREGDVMHSLACVKRSKLILNWEAQRTLDEGLQELVTSYLF